MKVETIDPFADIRGREDVFVGTLPRTRATLSLPPRTAMAVGWRLFWRSLWWAIRREHSITFWLEDGS
jgi:hypothetical protein